jgi:8-hydroxy-5-deazaflavin:NADPH oxidoreductase
MKLGIIGTGAIGSTIAKKLAAAGHAVKVNNADKPHELAKKAKELGATPATINEVVKDVEVIIVSVPTVAIPELPKDLFTGVPDDVIVVDTSNYYPFRDGEIEELKNGKVESVWVSEQLGRPVIKAFNNLLAHSLAHLGKSEGEEGRIAMAVSGDDENAKKIVSRLINDAGFDAVDAGSLSESWRHQPGTPAYCTELNVPELKEALADGIKDKASELRDLAIINFMERTTSPTHEDVVAANRSLFSSCVSFDAVRNAR